MSRFRAALQQTSSRVLRPRRAGRRRLRRAAALFVAGAVSITFACVDAGVTGLGDQAPTPDPIATVVVALPAVELTVGQTAQAGVAVRTVSGALLTGRTITWTSSDSTIASVTAAGVVSALRSGTTTITATSEGHTGTAVLTVRPQPVASITVAIQASTLWPGQSTQASAIARDATGNVLADRSITWTTSDSLVATVSSSGLITAMGAGTVTITGRSESTVGSATFSVVEPPVATVSVSFGASTLVPGQTTTARAALKSSQGTTITNRDVSWTTSDPRIAIASPAGLVTAVAPGTVTIVATSEGQVGRATLTVRLPVVSVTVVLDNPTLPAGQTTQATAVPRDETFAPLMDRVVTWAVSDATIATISESGVITAIAPGTATISAQSEGKLGRADLTVQTPAPPTPPAPPPTSPPPTPPTPPPPTPPAPAPVNTVTVTLNSASVLPGQATQANAVLLSAAGVALTDRTIAWTSSADATATVSAAGLVVGMQPGSATITATSESKSGSATITVAPWPVVTVNVSLAAATIQVTQTTQATAATLGAGGPLSGRVVAWESSNPAVATVSATGLVTALTAGTTTIKATSETIVGTALLTVLPQPVATVNVTLAAASVALGQTTQATAVTLAAGGAVLPGRTIAWTSSDDAIATVSATGLVTAKAPGTATITATSENKTGGATVTSYVPVATVAVTPLTANVMKGATFALAAALKDSVDGPLTGRTIAWSSSNAAIATVSAAGVVTGVALGSPVTITALSEGKSGTATITVVPVPVATVVVAPTTADLIVGNALALAVTLRDSITGPLPPGDHTVTWTSNSPFATVNGSGLVTGVQVGGPVTITATTENGKTGTATITLLPRVDTVDVTLSIEGALPGGTAQASVRLASNDGTLLTRPVVWSSTNPAVASVSASGAVTALTPGSTTIRATVEGKNDGKTFTVQANVASHEPAGMSALMDRGFDALGELTWDDDVYHQNLMRIVQDATAPRSPSNVAEIKYPGGFPGGGAPVDNYLVLTDTARTVYISYWVKLSSNFEGHPSGVNKQIYAWSHFGPDVYVSAQGEGSDPLQPQVRLQGGNLNANLEPNLVPSAKFSRGVWHRWELVLKGNTENAADGAVDFWLDGLHIGSYQNVQINEHAVKWTQLMLSPNWGGNDSAVAQDMFMWVDHLYMSRQTGAGFRLPHD